MRRVDVRLSPNSGAKADIPPLRLGAMNRHRLVGLAQLSIRKRRAQEHVIVITQSP